MTPYDGPPGEVPPAVLAYESRIDVTRAEIVRLTGERDAARAEIERLSSEAEQQHGVVRQWKAVADREHAKARAAEATLRDLAEHGTGFDLNPTVDGDDTWAYVRHIEQMDDRVREIASAALTTTTEGNGR